MSNIGHDLSNIRYTDGKDHSYSSVAIVVSRWNPIITNALYQGAKDVLIAAGVKEDNIFPYQVPGTFELPLGAQMALQKREGLDGVICLGCVIQGETRHFDFICQAAANGIMEIGLTFDVPAIFGVLTPNTQEQAEARAGGKLGNKGEEAAVALLQMIDLQRL